MKSQIFAILSLLLLASPSLLAQQPSFLTKLRQSGDQSVHEPSQAPLFAREAPHLATESDCTDNYIIVRGNKLCLKSKDFVRVGKQYKLNSSFKNYDFSTAFRARTATEIANIELYCKGNFIKLGTKYKCVKEKLYEVPGVETHTVYADDANKEN